MLDNRHLLGVVWGAACFLSACTQPAPPASAPASTALFSLLSPEQTGISFQNELTAGLNANILLYEYFYNGGGVAAGDFNGDGRVDLYFSANMSPNRLYLNEGGMNFREVTEQSKAGGRTGPWKTGVTAVDINGDRKLDLYLCYSGMMPDEKRANQLFINQGNDAEGVPQFVEQAEAYGLASIAYSNQGVFFDYDRDGDLDMLLLNHNPKNLPILDEVKSAQMLQQDDPLQGVRLFRQDAGRFSDVTSEAGINGSPLTYGLGIGVADLDRDGWPDFYLSNDYTVPDYLYHNNGDGTFTDQLQQRMGHNSQFSMGNDLADYNNDGWVDVVTLDMLPEDNRRQKLLLAPDNYPKFDLNVRSGFGYQYMRNMLQLNNGDGSFSEIGQIAGISNTDWSWSALLADYNNDGWKDLYITNGYYRDYTNLDFIKYMDAYVQEKGRLQKDDVLSIIEKMPASNVSNYLFVNNANQTFSDQTAAWGLSRPSNSNGAAYADLDNDGDLDLIVNNINQPAFIYRNDSKSSSFLQVELEGEGLNSQGIGAVVEVWANGESQMITQSPARGYLSSVSPILHVGLGAAAVVDSLRITWPKGETELHRSVTGNQRLVLKQSDAGGSTPARPARPARPASLLKAIPAPLTLNTSPGTWQDFDRQALLLRELSFEGPSMAQGDLNGDGRIDIVAGGGHGEAMHWFAQDANGRFQQKSVPAWEEDRAAVDADVAIFDANADGHLDVFVVSGGYHDLMPQDERLVDRLYLNNGKGEFAKADLAVLRLAGSCVAVGDANGDGHPDLFVGGGAVPGRWPEAAISYLLINDGKGRFSEQTAMLAPEMSGLGMVTDAAWADLNRDGRDELVVVGEWMPLTVFGLQEGLLQDLTTKYLGEKIRGLWTSLAVEDLNGDGFVDIVAGNLGLNTQVKAGKEAPAELFFNDFDQNGSVDPLFSLYVQGKSYPYLTRDEMLGQLASLRARYPSYDSYAGLTLLDIFGEQTLQQAKRLEVNTLNTMILLNRAGEALEAVALPMEAQYSPVHSIAILDADGDGLKDVLLCGNDSHAKLRLGKMDANHGVLMRGGGGGKFVYVPQAESGLFLRGDVRSLLVLDRRLLIGFSQGPVQAYQITHPGK